MEILDKKTIWNATSAYLMIFISGLFLFNKDNKYLNNEFVKSHTKRALIIHLGFLITYIVFISNWLWKTINLLWIQLNNIIATSLFILLLWFLIFWIYKTRKWETYTFSELNKYEKIQLLDVSWDWKISERDKLTIILSYIPLIWFLNYWKYLNKKVIQNSTRLNIFITIILILLQIFNHWNLSLIIALIYIIFIIFIWINLFTRDELIQITLPKLFSPEYKYIFQSALINYLKNYFKNDSTISFNEILKNKINKKETQELEENNKLLSNSLSTNSLKSKWRIINKIKFLIYIPFLNLVFLFFKKSKYSFHIINWITITALIIITTILSKYWYLYSQLNIFFLLPILFWISYLNNNRLAYKMPYIYDLYQIFNKTISIFKIWSKKIKEKNNEVNEVKLEVWK